MKHNTINPSTADETMAIHAEYWRRKAKELECVMPELKAIYSYCFNNAWKAIEQQKPAPPNPLRLR